MFILNLKIIQSKFILKAVAKKINIMKLKFIITIFLAIILSEFSIANFYKKGDTLHVWATSGLNMREGPGTDFPKMKKLDYGDKVQVIDDYLRSTPLNITVIKKSQKSAAYVMKGHWVRVIIGSQEGYVFDGYLSRLPILKKRKTTNSHEIPFESFLTYAEREFGIEYFEYDSSEVKNFRSHHIYKNGFERKIANGSCYEYSLELTGLQSNEAYLIFNLMYGFEKNLKELKIEEYEFSNDPENITAQIIKEENQFYSFSFGSEFSSFGLLFQDGKFTIIDWACC